MKNIKVFAISGDGSEIVTYDVMSIGNQYFNIVKEGVSTPLAKRMYDAKGIVKVIFDDIPKRGDRQIDHKKYTAKIQEVADLWERGIYSIFSAYSYLNDTPEYLKEFKERLMKSIPKNIYHQEIYFDEFLIPINFSGAFSNEGGSLMV